MANENNITTGQITGGLAPKDFDGLYRLANIVFLAKKFLPLNTYSNAEEVFVAMQMGMEIRLTPMQAIHSIAIIKGRPTVWGDALLAIAQGTGKLTSFVERFEDKDGELENNDTFSDSFTAICEVERSDMKNTFTYTFSVADAKKAGLWARGSSGPRNAMALWYKYPKRMLQMRARSWALRAAFSDALRGFYAAEELVEDKEKASKKPINKNKISVKTEAEVETPKVSTSDEGVSKTPADVSYALNDLCDAEAKGSYVNPDKICEYISFLSKVKGTSQETICNMVLENNGRTKATLDSYLEWIEKTKKESPPNKK